MHLKQVTLQFLAVGARRNRPRRNRNDTDELTLDDIDGAGLHERDGLGAADRRRPGPRRRARTTPGWRPTRPTPPGAWTNWRSWRRRWWTRSSASASWASRKSRPRSTSPALLEKQGFKVQRGVSGIPTAWVATWGIGQAGDRAGLRHRRHSAGVAEAGRGLSRSDHRRRARAWRRAQHRHAAQHRRGDRGEADHGARQAAGHADAVAGRGRGAAGVEGLVRARRHVQGRRRHAVHARRQQPRTCRGAMAAATA